MTHTHRVETIPFIPGAPTEDAPRTSAMILDEFAADGWEIVSATNVTLQPSRLQPERTLPALTVVLRKRAATEGRLMDELRRVKIVANVALERAAGVVETHPIWPERARRDIIADAVRALKSHVAAGGGA